MDESNSSLDSLPSSRELEEYGLTSGAIYVGDDLKIDLWVRTSGAEPQSIMIRSIDPQGVINSTFMHIEGEQVRRIPTFGNGIELANESKAQEPPKQLAWNSENGSRIPIDKEQRIILRRTLEVFGVAVVAAVVAMLAFGAIQLRTVLTGSMIPAIKPGDIVVAAAPQWNSPQVGKVAIYNARDLQGRAVASWAHRIVGGDAIEGFTMKGDANATEDVNHPKLADIQGVVLFKIPTVGHYLNPFTVGLGIIGICVITWVKRRW